MNHYKIIIKQEAVSRFTVRILRRVDDGNEIDSRWTFQEKHLGDLNISGETPNRALKNAVDHIIWDKLEVELEL